MQPCFTPASACIIRDDFLEGCVRYACVTHTHHVRRQATSTRVIMTHLGTRLQTSAIKDQGVTHASARMGRHWMGLVGWVKLGHWLGLLVGYGWGMVGRHEVGWILLVAPI